MIFLDCGAHCGESILEAQRRFGPFKKIFAFEPCNLLYKYISLKFKDDESILPIHAAVSGQSGTSFLWYSTTRTDGSTVLEGKKTGKISYGELKNECFGEWVKTISISDWIQENIPCVSFMLKLDIEGSELDVLEDLLRNIDPRYINRLFIEWHTHKFRNKEFLFRKRSIKQTMIHCGIVPESWPKIKFVFNDAPKTLLKVDKNVTL